MKGIEHSKAVFEQRVRMQDRVLERRAFDAWRAVRFGSVAKQQLLAKCIKRLMQRKLARAFAAWHDKFHLVDRTHEMRRKVRRRQASLVVLLALVHGLATATCSVRFGARYWENSKVVWFLVGVQGYASKNSRVVWFLVRVQGLGLRLQEQQHELQVSGCNVDSAWDEGRTGPCKQLFVS